jgi:hypothetical protein
MPLYNPPAAGSGGGGTAAWGDVTGTLSDQTDLQGALDAKAGSTHSHAQSDVTNLVTDLAAKASTSHNHDSAYEAKNSNIQTHIASAHAPSDAQKNSDITKAEIEAVLTGTISSHSHSGGGSDPWTYVKLGSDFSITTAAFGDVTGMAFTPAANTDYAFEIFLMCRTATTTTGPRPGIVWPGGTSDGAVTSDMTTTATARLIQNGNPAASVQHAVGGLNNTTRSWPCTFIGVFRMGASPSGDFKLQLASETEGTSVTIKAGSYIRYRTY